MPAIVTTPLFIGALVLVRALAAACFSLFLHCRGPLPIYGFSFIFKHILSCCEFVSNLNVEVMLFLVESGVQLVQGVGRVVVDIEEPHFARSQHGFLLGNARRLGVVDRDSVLSQGM